MNDPVIVAAVRTAIGKAPNGRLRSTRPDEMAATVLRAALERVPALDPAEIDDVARIASLRAGLPVSASAATINRFCASGLEAIAIAAGRIRAGEATVVLAGGTESMSLIPMGGHQVSPNPHLIATYPDTYLSTGLVAENHARTSGISRDDQDAFALQSHQRAIAAIDAGRFNEEIVPLDVAAIDQSNGRPVIHTSRFDRDEGPRRDTSAGALARLKPAFHASGTVTAGNSSQTSDGAAAVVVMSARRARELGIAPLARIGVYATAGVKPELFGIGPVPAVRKALDRAGLALDDIDLVEINEAFASQVLACLQELPIDPDRLNVNGGAIALGHPLGCTGARLTTSLLGEMARRSARYGMVTLCIGGGMGAAMIFERAR
jgi:acetyl-CoA acyltransferase